MPDQYSNPTEIRPCAGNYDWKPPTIPEIGTLNPTKGFDNLVIDRGAFRNLYYNSESDNNVIITVSKKNLLGGQKYYPVRNSTRPLVINKKIRKANNNNLVLAPNESNELYKLSNFSDSKRSFNVSSIELEYDLSFWIGDEEISSNISSFFNLTQKQKSAFNNLTKKYTQNGTLSGDAVDIEDFVTGLAPNPLEVWSANQPKQLKGVTLGFQLTRVRSTQDILKENPNPVTAKTSTTIDAGVKFNKINIKLGDDEINRDAYPKLNDLVLKVRDIFKGTSLALVIKSIKVFAADRVNLQFNGNQAQLPATAIGYSLYINGSFFPMLQYSSTLASSGGSIGGSGSVGGTGFFTWPDGKTTTNNIHVKIFNPDDPFNSPGFAHSINLHLSILSFNVGDPFADFLLAGALPYFGVILGPTPFLQQFTFYGTSKSNNDKSVAVAFGQSSLKPTQGTYSLLINDESTTVSQNIPILSYLQVLNNKQDFYNIINSTNIIEQNLNNQSNINSGYKLRFVDQFGQASNSNSFGGSPFNVSDAFTTYFNAYDEIPFNKFETKLFTYNSFVSISDSKNRLYDLFTKSKPLLIFKLNTQTYLSNLFFQSSFISTTINALVKDPVGILDTKLVYRIYAVKKDNKNFDPNFSENLTQTFKITLDPNTNKNYLSIEKFDKSWTFDNILSTWNLETSLETINTSVFVNGYLPDKDKTVNSNVLNGASNNYEFYCAIYAISILNDNPKKYNLNTFTSLDFPLVQFSLSTDFVLLLPFFYTISFQNGGFIRPQRDLGYTANYNDKDTEVYQVYDVFYGGDLFDNKKPYSGRFSLIDGFDKLLVCDFDSTLYPNISTAFTLEIPKTDQTTNAFFEVDFVVLSKFDLQNAKISDEDDYNTWTVTLDLDQPHDNIEVKFEFDLINSDFQNLIKVVSSEFISLSESTLLNKQIKQSFYLPSSSGTLLLRLFFKNTKNKTTIQISNLKITKNSIKLFTYSSKAPGSADYGFYEDLPLQPTGFVGACNQFALWLDLPPAGYTIFDGNPGNTNAGLFINGALYSSTWILPKAYPAGMEVATKGLINDSFTTGTQSRGSTPYKIFFRAGQSSNVLSLDTKRHGITNLIVTTTNSLTDSLQNGIWQVISEAYPRYFTFGDYLVTYDQDGNIQNLILSNPTLNTTSEMLILGQSQNFSNNNSLALAIESPGSYALQSQNVDIINPIATQNEQKTRMKYCIFTSFAYAENKIYTLGITPGGNLLYSETSVWDQSQNLTISLIEGNPNSKELINTEVQYFADNYYGIVAHNFPAIAKTSSSEAIVFYVYSSGKNVLKNNAIYVRVISSNTPYNPVLLFDFQSYLNEAILRSGISNFVVDNINQISVYADEFLPNLYHIVFDCSNKLFVLKVLYSLYTFNFIDVAIVLGTYQQQKTPFEKIIFESVTNIGNIINLNINEKFDNPYAINLSNSQRVGIIDFDGFFLGVQFLDDQKIKEIVFDKSYTIKAELRTIGVKPG